MAEIWQIAFLQEDSELTRNMLIPSTIVTGLYALQQTIGPVLIYYLWLDKKTTSEGNSVLSNKWTNIAWMVYWISSIAVFGLSALMWPFSYIGGHALSIYSFSWVWAEHLGPAALLLTFTMLLTAGIQQPGDKTVWETLVVWLVVNGATGMIAKSQAEATELYYLWGEHEDTNEKEGLGCVEDSDGNCS